MAVSVYVIAAIAGCWYRESNLQPGVWESLVVADWDTLHYTDDRGFGVGGYGLGQWTNTGSGDAMRNLNRHNWMIGAGYQDDDGVGQLAYFIHENIWYYTPSLSHTNTRTLEEFLNTDNTNLRDLVWDFLAFWEGVPGDVYEERVSNAEYYISYLIEHASDDPTQYQWTTENNYQSKEQSLNNLMCIYFGLNGYVPPGPGPGPTPTKKKKMPLWFYLRKF